MARTPEFKPKKIGKRYKLYVPGQGIVDLETTDEKEAWTKAGQHAQQYAARKGPKVTTQNLPTVQGPTAESMLDAWKQLPQSSTPSPDTQSPSVSSSTQSGQLPLPSQSPTITPTVLPPPTAREKVAEIMPTDRRKKIADLMAKGMMRLNVAACALTVNLLGRVPGAEEDSESEEVLQEGWALQLEEWFVETPPAPWMVILGGSLSVGMGMYMTGTPKPKPQIGPPGGGDYGQTDTASPDSGT